MADTTESLNDEDEVFLDESSGICLEEIPRNLDDFLPGRLRMQDHQWNSNAQDDWNFINMTAGVRVLNIYSSPRGAPARPSGVSLSWKF